MAAPRGMIAMAVVFAAAAGAAVRVLSGNAILHTDLVYSPAQKESIPGATNPESTARSFYLYVDGGMYDKAYDVSLEPVLRQGGSYEEKTGLDRFSGWTSREEFVSRMNRELGHGGSGIRLGSIRAGEAALFGGTSARGTEPDRADTLLSRIAELEGAYRVPVSGHLLGACSVFNWKKDLTVVKTAGQYKVLLDGTRGARTFSYQSWFENIEKLADLRGGGNDRVLR